MQGKDTIYVLYLTGKKCQLITDHHQAYSREDSADFGKEVGGGGGGVQDWQDSVPAVRGDMHAARTACMVPGLKILIRDGRIAKRACM